MPPIAEIARQLQRAQSLQPRLTDAAIQIQPVNQENTTTKMSNSKKWVIT